VALALSKPLTGHCSPASCTHCLGSLCAQYTIVSPGELGEIGNPAGKGPQEVLGGGDSLAGVNEGGSGT
jgi:hypothetical protein